MRDDLIEEVRSTCTRPPAMAGITVVIDEPYAPYIPPRWNGRLVVAEAQNLAGDTEYVRRLKAATPRDRVSRLHWDAPSNLGIGPWDDGTLKLAVTAAWPHLSCSDFAVSNAVLWSQTADGRNVNPEESLHGYSVEVWKRIVAVMKPVQIVTVGKIANDVIRMAANVPVLRWAAASPVYLNRVAWLFDSTDLLSRFPPVASAAAANAGWLESNREAKLFYACHAASMAARLV